MNLKVKLILAAVALVGQSFVVLSAQAANASDSTVTLRGKIHGVSNDIVTILHTERGRKVDDPVLINAETQIWFGKKQVSLKYLRIKQSVKVTGVQDGELIVASRIDILSGAVTVKAALKPKK